MNTKHATSSKEPDAPAPHKSWDKISCNWKALVKVSAIIFSREFFNLKCRKCGKHQRPKRALCTKENSEKEN